MFKRPFKIISEEIEIEDNLVLTEGLIVSYNPNLLVSELTKEFNISKKSIQIQSLNYIAFEYNRNIENDPEFIRSLNLYGYNLNRVDLNTKTRLFEYSIEPKFPSIANNIPNILYHVSPSKYDDKIMKIGLTPRESKTSFNHQGNRIYLFATSDVNDIFKLVKGIHAQKSSKQNIGSYYVYSITPKEGTRYYYDPDLQIGDISSTCYGVFTLRNVPPTEIKYSGEIKV